MTMRPSALGFGLTGLALVATLYAQAPATTSKTRAHVTTLASERFEGRLAGSNGERLASEYLSRSCGAGGSLCRAMILLPFDSHRPRYGFELTPAPPRPAAAVTSTGARSAHRLGHVTRAAAWSSPVTHLVPERNVGYNTTRRGLKERSCWCSGTFPDVLHQNQGQSARVRGPAVQGDGRAPARREGDVGGGGAELA